MTVQDMHPSHLPPVQPHHPTTFLERGVSLPCTTPLLLGARARPADRGGLEIIVPNPAGGRGVYIAPWNGIRQLCRPTVHDSRLYQLIAERPGITPATIREAARSVAAQGLAGRDAAASASLAQAADQRDQATIHVLLLMAAVRHAHHADKTNIPLPDLAALRLCARADIESLASRLGRSADAVLSDITQLAQLLAPIGFERQTPPARVPRLLSEIVRFRAEAARWARAGSDRSAAQAGLSATIAGVTITCAEITLADAYAQTADIVALLSAWILSPETIARRLARTEWLVDGWEQICLLWRAAANDAARRAALAEIALLVPILPQEVATWLGRQADLEPMRIASTIVAQDTDWRTGLHFERIARNEMLRALAT